MGDGRLVTSRCLSADRISDCRPLAELIEKHRSNAPSDRCDIGSDGHRIGLGSDDHRIGLAGQPFEFESERNGEQAIDDRMLPALAPALRARTPTPLPTGRLAQAPHARAYFLRR